MGEGVVYINTGYRIAELWAVRPDGEGDVTSSHVLWKRDRHVANRASPLLIGGLIYMCTDRGIVSCIDAKTGAEVWVERLGGNYSASPIYADGRIYFFSHEGKTTVIRPGRRFEHLAVSQLDDGFMASPAVAGKALFLRTRSHLYRIEKRTPGD